MVCPFDLSHGIILNEPSHNYYAAVIIALVFGGAFEVIECGKCQSGLEMIHIYIHNRFAYCAGGL